MPSNDKLIQIGELLYDIAENKNGQTETTIRSDDERLSGLSISEIENLLDLISQESKSFSGYKKIETIDGIRQPIIKFTMLIDDQLLRDYLIKTYGISRENDVELASKLQLEEDDNKVCYWISFNDTGKIILNDKYLMARTQAGSNSDSLMAYLYKHPNQICLKTDIQREFRIEKEINRSFSKTTDELGFRGELKKLFFKVSKDKVIFRNLITNKQVRELHIDTDKLIAKISLLKHAE